MTNDKAKELATHYCLEKGLEYDIAKHALLVFDGDRIKSAFLAGYEARDEEVQKLVDALKESLDFIQDVLARANQAIDTDCPKGDYQCEGCIRNIDDAEFYKKRIKKLLKEFEGEK